MVRDGFTDLGSYAEHHLETHRKAYGQFEPVVEWKVLGDLGLRRNALGVIVPFESLLRGPKRGEDLGEWVARMRLGGITWDAIAELAGKSRRTMIRAYEGWAFFEDVGAA